MTLLIAQLKGIVAVAVYTLAVSLVFWYVVKATLGLRVSKEEEEEGLDIGEHGQVAYIIRRRQAQVAEARAGPRVRETCRDRPTVCSRRWSACAERGFLHGLLRRRCMRCSRVMPPRHGPCSPIVPPRRRASRWRTPTPEPVVHARPAARLRARLRDRLPAAAPGGRTRSTPLPVWLLAAEVFATILGLFLFGSFRYQIHKNALTYGMLLVIVATFSGLPSSEWHTEIADTGWWSWTRAHLLSFRGLDDLIHADTMLFILGLTFFVSVIAQTRLLEGITLFLLRRKHGAILPTVISVTAVVAFASGDSRRRLDDRADDPDAGDHHDAGGRCRAGRSCYAVMVCTAVTTICGIWLAYGEPPNLIMKANLHPFLGNAFFLSYCAPVAVASLPGRCQAAAQAAGGTARRSRRDGRHRRQGRRRPFSPGDAPRRGADAGRARRSACGVAGPWRATGVLERLRSGSTLGSALIHEGVPPATGRMLLGHYVSEELADGARSPLRARCRRGR